MRKDCVVPKCDGRNNFGHTTEDCFRTHATAFTAATVVSSLKDAMEEEDAEAASSSARFESEEMVKRPEQPPFSEPSQEGSCDPKTIEDAPTTVTSTAAAKPGDSGNAGKPKTKTARKPTKTMSCFASPAGEARSQPSWPVRHEDMDVAVMAAKRDLELDSTPRTPGARKRLDTISAPNVSPTFRRRPGEGHPCKCKMPPAPFL